MPTERKQDLIRSMGEFDSQSWTIPQLRARIAEVKTTMQEEGIKTLKTEMIALNRAARKKPNLVTFAQEIEVEIKGSDTIATIYARRTTGNDGVSTSQRQG